MSLVAPTSTPLASVCQRAKQTHQHTLLLPFRPGNSLFTLPWCKTNKDTEIKVEIIDSPIPKPNADQVLIKVIVSGSNPKDWKRPALFKKAYNSGDDFAGIVESVGDNITEFKAGDRVAGCHEMGAPNGSFAEYTIAWAASTFHIPKKISFEEVRFPSMLLSRRSGC